MAETYLLNGDYIGDLNEENPFQSHEHYTILTVVCEKGAVAMIELKFEEQALSVSSFEKEKGAHWQVEMMLPGQHESVDLSDVSGVHHHTLTPLEMRDWVTENQKDFPPLEIGGFYIHGSHLPPKEDAFSLEIDAGRAFGTGEHATTAGCLLAMEKLAEQGESEPLDEDERPVGRSSHEQAERRLSRGQEPERGKSNSRHLKVDEASRPSEPSARETARHVSDSSRDSGRNLKIVDIGCGTGILTLAARYLWPDATIIGGDMDTPSVTTAIENAQKNAISDVSFVSAAGTQHPQIQASAPYNLIVANILAGPLIELAPEMRAVLAQGGRMILSGLLVRQQKEVLAAYMAQGLILEDEIHREEWSAITLQFA